MHQPVGEHVADMRKGISLISGALAPCVALASGDPGVIWWTAGAIVVQLVVAGFLSRLSFFRPLRGPILVAYVLFLVPAWLWGLNVPGPDFGHVDAVLIGGPIVFAIGAATVLAWVRASRS